MIGKWQRFGEGDRPKDGEGFVFICPGGDYLDVLEGRGAYLVFAVCRDGGLFEQDGSSTRLPYGAPWTSLPPPGSVSVWK